eukprot:5005254-Pyramimonas_sp.AAC.1
MEGLKGLTPSQSDLKAPAAGGLGDQSMTKSEAEEEEETEEGQGPARSRYQAMAPSFRVPSHIDVMTL